MVVNGTCSHTIDILEVTMCSRRTVIGLALGASVLVAGGVTASASSGSNGDNGGSLLHRAHSSVSDLLDRGSVAPGTIDDGKDLLPKANISLDDAVAAAQASANGDLGEVDLEYYHGVLVFNVDIGDNDVKVDASTGVVLGSGSD